MRGRRRLVTRRKKEERVAERERLKTRQRPCLSNARTSHADNNDDIGVRLSKALALATSKEVLHVTGSREDRLGDQELLRHGQDWSNQNTAAGATIQ